MTRPNLLKSRWTQFPPSRAFCLAALVAGVVVPLFAALLIAQAPRRASTSPLEAVTRALIEGRYDEVDALSEKLDARDPGVVALKARAAIARGRYAEAESVLRPVATRAPASEAALELGLLEQMLGRAGATATLERVAAPRDRAVQAEGLARSARALRALGRFQESNAAYRDAAAAAPADAAINSAWGELFLEKYNKPEALKSFQAVLQRDPRWTPALLGSARTLADENPPQAISVAKRALEINPSYVDAHVFLASQAVDADHRDEARQLLERALAVNPSSLETHAWLAALDYVEDKEKDFEAEVAKALAVSPSYGEVYRVAGELAARNYRFDEAVVLARRALTLTPSDPHVLADLGMHLLRTGDEPGARAAIDRSLDLDPFDDIVRKNLLKMMDRLDKFTTVHEIGKATVPGGELRPELAVDGLQLGVLESGLRVRRKACDGLPGHGSGSDCDRGKPVGALGRRHLGHIRERPHETHRIGCEHSASARRCRIGADARRSQERRQEHRQHPHLWHGLSPAAP